MIKWHAGISLGMRPANERRRYIVTTSLIGWEHTLGMVTSSKIEKNDSLQHKIIGTRNFYLRKCYTWLVYLQQGVRSKHGFMTKQMNFT